MTTIQDIADRLGISKGTVSKALNDASDISESLQKQILETAVEMGYTKLRRQRGIAKRLCVLVEKDKLVYEEPHQLGYDIIMGFRQMAEPAGYAVDIIPIDEEMQKSTSYEIFMLQHDYLGSFVLGFSLADPWMQDFHSSRTPAVLYDNQILSNPATAYVGIDNEEGMYLAVSHLKELGHQRIGYLSDPMGSHIMQLRQNAFFHAMERNCLLAGSEDTGHLTDNSDNIAQELQRLLQRGTTALICSHDQIARAVILQCRRLGLRIPQDLSIVGFDDLPFSPRISPSLTTIRQERTELGKCGYYALDSLMNNVSIGTVLLHARLIVRHSTVQVVDR